MSRRPAGALRRSAYVLPESVAELCLVRVGFRYKGISAAFFARRIRRDLDASVGQALAGGLGLLHSDRFEMGRGHFGLLQYWASFADVERWIGREPHAGWWREALDRARSRGDFGVYHETYLVPRDRVESTALNVEATGLAAFGTMVDATGKAANSRGRLGLGPRGG
jgi:hypothetical protein